MKYSTIKSLSDVPQFLTGGGEMGQRIREFDWSSTSLGPIETWPRSLRTCVQIMLTSQQPIWIGWGKELIKLYNDPYKAIVGGKHPWALGKPASLVWKDIWRDIEPMLHQVMVENEGTYVEAQLLIMERNGYQEETYYTFSYTPITGDQGETEGMICFNTDDTERILSERQLKTLTQLGKSLANSENEEEVCKRTIKTVEQNARDFPFALLYTLDENTATFCGSIDEHTTRSRIPDKINLNSADKIAQLCHRACSLRQHQIIDELSIVLGDMPKGGWEICGDRAIILPIAQRGQQSTYGFMIIGLNPFRLLDENFLSFYLLIADQVATSFNHVHAIDEERKRLEALSQIDKAKTTFFSNISHEFRTPLTLLLGPIQDLLNTKDLNNSNREKAQVAFRNALRMQKLVNMLLDFSRIEAGRMRARFKSVDIVSLTEDLASSFRSAIEKAGMELIIKKDIIEEAVLVDVEMWEKIILNLISNAFKYSEKGFIEVSIKKVNQYVEVKVVDTGVGIDENEIDKIFDRFYRAQNKKGRSQEGTGIGLAMVKELVKLHGGSISVKSKVGEGSVFTIAVPLTKSSGRILFDNGVKKPSLMSSAFTEEALQWIPENKIRKDIGIEVQIARNKDKQFTILLADDNADMRKYVQRLFDSEYKVVLAADGEEAFEKIKEATPDLVLSDIMMPKLDGFGLLEKIRNGLSTRNIPVIFLSARAGDEAKIDGLKAGADDYLTKPFSSKELLARVNSRIAMTVARRQAEKEFYNLFLQSPAIINVMKGPDYIVEFFHPLAIPFVGEDITGMKMKEAMPYLESQGYFKMLDSVYQDGEAIHLSESKVTFPTKSGQPSEHYFNITFLPWLDLDGRIQGILQFAFEVTETVNLRLKAEEKVSERTKALKDLNQTLKLSNEDLHQFAHVASHDLKEPIRKIKTYSSRLQQDYNDVLSDKGRNYLNKILSATERMYSMIEGVLMYSNMVSLSQKAEQVDLNQLVNDIRNDLEVCFEERGAVIQTDQLPIINGVPVLLYQLFYNLINNSLRFSKVTEPPVIIIRSISIEMNAQYFVQIILSDNGIGFSQEHSNKIFTTFTRLNSRDKYEGIGLGLALCKKIVHRHRGFITATGEENKGATFTILLPIK